MAEFGQLTDYWNSILSPPPPKGGQVQFEDRIYSGLGAES